MNLFNEEPTTAVFDASRVYRYLLMRTWNKNRHPAVFIMLNPSTADANQDDPTIRRCINFASAWGYGGLVVVNLYAWRATDPRDLLTCSVRLATGPDNDAYIEKALLNAGVVVAAWGATAAPGIEQRVATVRQLVQASGNRLLCLSRTKDGHPGHPLYQPANQPLQTFQ